MGTQSFTFDIMVGDTFICTMRYPKEKMHTIISGGEVIRNVIDDEELKEFILGKMPSLKNRKYRIAF